MLLYAAKNQTAMEYISVYIIVIDILLIIGFDFFMSNYEILNRY